MGRVGRAEPADGALSRGPLALLSPVTPLSHICDDLSDTSLWWVLAGSDAVGMRLRHHFEPGSRHRPTTQHRAAIRRG
eukprot:m.65269 g.65269  ORF g.65269 m.65269 type:complete len:78 (-) comp17966_c0_seq2:876-1109(-)